MLGVVVVVLVAASEAETPTTSAMVSTMRDGLSDAVVVVHAAPPSDDNAIAVGAQVHADAVVVVTWPTAARARLRVRVMRDGRWEERELVFAPSDAPAERGRAVGLASITLIPPDAPKAVVVAPEPKPQSTPVTAAPRPPVVAPSPPPRWTFALDAAALASFGLGGRAGGLGGELAVHAFGEGVGVRALGGVRFGAIEDARIATSTARFGVGFAVDVARASYFDVRLLLDVLAVRHGIARTTFDGGLDTRTRWLGGAGVSVEGELRLGRRFGLVFAPGLELALGETRVVVGVDTVATIPRARGLAWIGVRVRL